MLGLNKSFDSVNTKQEVDNSVIEQVYMLRYEDLPNKRSGGGKINNIECNYLGTAKGTCVESANFFSALATCRSQGLPMGSKVPHNIINVRAILSIRAYNCW